MIKLMVIGHLGKDAEVREVNGKKVIAFSVAHSEKYRDSQGNQQSRTTWVRCSYWNDNTNIVPYLRTGTQIFVEGTPSVDAYMSSTQNQPAASLDLRVLRVELLGGNTSSENNGKESNYNKTVERTTTTPPVAQEDDLPF
jgi:single-strand DNA-binding protein